MSTAGSQRPPRAVGAGFFDYLGGHLAYRQLGMEVHETMSLRCMKMWRRVAGWLVLGIAARGSRRLRRG